jgi:IS30 family transposase
VAQLTLVQRYEIPIGLSLNQPYSQIGSTIDKDKSVMSREIKRNSDARNGKYRAQLAHEKATNRHTDKNKKEYFTAENKKYVEKYLAEKFSPEQIVGRAIIDGISCVSHETIYQYIWKDKKANGKRYKSLRNKGKRYRKRGGTMDTRGLIVGRVDVA